MRPPDAIRRARLQWLMAGQLVNWRDAWHAYATAQPMPPLRFRNGSVLHSRPVDSAGAQFFEIFANGCYRRGLPDTLDGDVVDIGANIGAFTLDAARHFRSATVHAYEPDAQTCEVLQRNVEENGLSSRVRIWNEAVSGAPGTLRLWRGDGSITASAYPPAPASGTGSDVIAVTLQTVVARTSGRVGLLKMDCEGAEAEILETAGTALDAIEYLVAEYHPALVPDVVNRMRQALRPAFDVVVSAERRCADLMWAHRTAASARS